MIWRISLRSTYCACANTTCRLGFVWRVWRELFVRDGVQAVHWQSLCSRERCFCFSCWSYPGVSHREFQLHLVGLWFCKFISEEGVLPGPGLFLSMLTCQELSESLYDLSKGFMLLVYLLGFLKFLCGYIIVPVHCSVDSASYNYSVLWFPCSGVFQQVLNPLIWVSKCKQCHCSTYLVSTNYTSRNLYYSTVSAIYIDSDHTGYRSV